MVELRNYELYAGSASPLIGAAVALYASVAQHPNPGAVLATTQTDSSGMWEFVGLADGLYDVKVTAPGAGHIKWYKGNVSVGSIVIPSAPVPPNSISTLEILDSTILNVDINAAAAIAITKLAHVGSGNVLKSNGTTNVGAKIVSADITDDTIVNADINTAAGVVVSKLAAGGTADRLVGTTNGTTMGMTQITNNMIPAGTIDATKLSFVPGGTPDDGSVTSAKILDGAIVNVDVNAAANIAITKLAHVGANNILKSNGTTNVAGQVVDADVAAAAAIAVTKVAHVGSGNVLKSTGTANVGGQVVNADISSSAAITYGKLNLAGTIVNADVATAAAIALAKLAPGSSGVLKSNGTAITAGNQIVAADIATDTITATQIATDAVGAAELAANAVVNVSVDPAAAIAVSKLAHVGSGNVLRSNGTTNVGGQIQAGDIAPGVVLSNPMTTANDLIIGGASGTPARLAKGSNGQVLGIDGTGNLAYTSTLTNPMTTPNDIIIGGASGAATRLAKGANGTVLGVDGAGNMAYVSPLTNPMTTTQDIIVGGASGAATRMAKGANSTYLRVSTGGLLEYGTLPVDPGFANPMTTQDDVIVGGASGAPGRLAKGASSTLLGVSAGGVLGYGQVTAAMIGTDAITASQLAADCVGASELADNSVADANVVAGAAIGVAKLGAGGTANRLVGTTDGTTMSMTQLVDAMVGASAAIAVTKLAHVGVGNVLKSNGTTANVAGQVVNADVAAGAAIAYSKLALAGSIQAADLATGVAMKTLGTATASGSSPTMLINTGLTNYRQLLLVVRGRVSAAGSGGSSCSMTVEASPTAGAYSQEMLLVYGANPPQSIETLNAASVDVGLMPTNGGTAGMYGVSWVFIDCEPSFSKTYFALNAGNNDNSANGLQQRNTSGVLQVAGYLTYVAFTASGGNWMTGSRVTAYGLPA